MRGRGVWGGGGGRPGYVEWNPLKGTAHKQFRYAYWRAVRPTVTTGW